MRVSNFIVNLFNTSYMRGVFVLVVVPKDNKSSQCIGSLKDKTTSLII